MRLTEIERREHADRPPGNSRILQAGGCARREVAGYFEGLSVASPSSLASLGLSSRCEDDRRWGAARQGDPLCGRASCHSRSLTGRRAGLGTATREWGRVVVLSVAA